MSIFATTEAGNTQADVTKAGLGNSFSHRLSNGIHTLNLGLIGKQNSSASFAIDKNTVGDGTIANRKVLSLTPDKASLYKGSSLSLMTGGGSNFQKHDFKSIVPVIK